MPKTDSMRYSGRYAGAGLGALASLLLYRAAADEDALNTPTQLAVAAMGGMAGYGAGGLIDNNVSTYRNADKAKIVREKLSKYFDDPRKFATDPFVKEVINSSRGNAEYPKIPNKALENTSVGQEGNMQNSLDLQGFFESTKKYLDASAPHGGHPIHNISQSKQLSETIKDIASGRYASRED